jgi:prefoldin subunit 5
MDIAAEMDMLKADADYMQKSLDAINKRIEELKTNLSNHLN